MTEQTSTADGLELVPSRCCVCGTADAEPIGVGEDFEYRTSPDTFLAVQCRTCQLVYLDPYPSEREFDRIYPDGYRRSDVSSERSDLVHRLWRRREARRLLTQCRHLPDDALILDVGCGDGFHLGLLHALGKRSWRLEGVDVDDRAAKATAQRGLIVHVGDAHALDLPEATVDLAFMIQTIEHVADPAGALRAVARVLKPGGRLVIVTRNTAALDFRIFRSRYWAGYDFPRHRNLFNRLALTRLATRCGYEVNTVSTVASHVTWVSSIRNLLDDAGAPKRVVAWFGRESAIPFALFTVVDGLRQLAGRGALLRVVLRKPR